MNTGGGSFDFEAMIDGDGRIEIPADVLDRLGSGAGTLMRVRLVPARIAAALERKNVTPEEVDRIAGLQLESREQVMAFLLAEGALACAGGATRRKKGRKRR